MTTAHDIYISYEMHKRATVLDFAKAVKAQGLRVFIAKSGEHGFYTDDKGERVISFHYDALIGGIRVSGNYMALMPSDGQKIGTGWMMTDSADIKDTHKYLDAKPPFWAVRAYVWKFTTLDSYLKTYGQSSGFSELED